MKYFMLFTFLILSSAIRASLGGCNLCDQYRQGDHYRQEVVEHRQKVVKHRQEVVERCERFLSRNFIEWSDDAKHERAVRACRAFRELYARNHDELLNKAEGEALKALNAVDNTAKK